MFESLSSFLVLYTDNIQATRNFYSKIGAQIIDQEEDKLEVVFADYSIHFILSSTEPFEEYQYATKTPYGLGALFYIGSEKIENAHKLIKTAGCPKITEIKENNWESREFLFEDPNGFKFVVYEV